MSKGSEIENGEKKKKKNRRERGVE